MNRQSTHVGPTQPRALDLDYDVVCSWIAERELADVDLVRACKHACLVRRWLGECRHDSFVVGVMYSVYLSGRAKR